jgi:cytochrome oxidase assembly protein ShyY1
LMVLIHRLETTTMTKAYFLLALLPSSLLFNACKKEEAQPQSIATVLVNGDMEASPYNDWGSYLGKNSTASPNKYVVEYTTEAASSPAHSIKVSSDAVKNDTTYQYLQQFFKLTDRPIPAGAKLTLKAKIKTSNIQGTGISIAMGGNQAITNSLGQVKKVNSTFYTSTEGVTPITGTNDFKEYTLTWSSLPAATTHLYVLLAYLPKTTGIVYFDDVVLSVN